MLHLKKLTGGLLVFCFLTGTVFTFFSLSFVPLIVAMDSSSSYASSGERIKNSRFFDILRSGVCTVFHGKDPEVAYVDYISGKRDYLDVSKDYR